MQEPAIDLNTVPARRRCELSRAVKPLRGWGSGLGCAVLLPVLAAALQWRFPAYLGPASWLPFIPAVLLSAWLCGGVCGIVATLGSAALGWWWFVPPVQALAKGPGGYVSTAVFVASGVLVSAILHALQGTNRRLLQRQVQYAQMFELAPDAAFIADLSGYFVDVNSSWCRTFDYSPAQVIGRGIQEVIPSGDLAQLQQLLTLLRRDGRCQAEWQLRHHNGDTVACEISASILPEGNWLGQVRDISERKLLELKLKHSAGHDLLTGLPNRQQFGRVLDAALERARWRQSRLALLYVDLDKFKAINDGMGHAAGDALLQQVSQQLAGSVRIGDTVARLGGDEFTVLLENLARAEDAGDVAAKIIGALRQPMCIEGQTLSISASIGIGIYPDHAETARELARHADTALYRAKEKGRDTFELYAAAPPSGDAARGAAMRPRGAEARSSLGLSAGMRASGCGD
jgi:diguanylate cyclase (GGDEF)-like protein/PAS domain S-box-containing protein